MNVFNLDSSIVRDYERFARSFTEIRAGDIREQVDAIYATGRFWPEPLISVNPHYELDADIADLVKEGLLHPNTADIFRVDSQPIVLYRHQAQAIAKATGGSSFVVTTGTGSGKSLCFFIPIIDAAIRARAAGQRHPYRQDDAQHQRPPKSRPLPPGVMVARFHRPTLLKCALA